MLKSITNYFKDKKQKKALDQLERDLRINFNGYGGITINGLVINEFTYLLDYICRQAKIECNFSLDFRFWNELADHKNTLLEYINIELFKDVLKEQESFNLSRETACINMENLKDIITAISIYVKESKKIIDS